MLVSVKRHHIPEDCSVNINLTEHKLIYITLLSLILLCVKQFVESVNVRAPNRTLYVALFRDFGI